MGGQPDIWRLGAYFLLAVGVVAGMIIVSALLGEHHRARARDEPYESGMIPTGGARVRFPIHFYLVAMFFVIFDLEAVYLFAWAVSVEEAGWTGFFEILVFVVILLAALVYLWRLGALDWGTARRFGMPLAKEPSDGLAATEPIPSEGGRE